MIRAGIGSSVSHSMIYVGGGNVIEAIDKGVVRQPIALSLNQAVLAIGLRRRNLTEKQRADVIKYATQYMFRPYDKIGAAGSGTNTGRGSVLAGFGCSISLLFCAAGAAAARDNAKPENADKSFFCSELVARVFEMAGAPVVEGAASAATPRHIRVATALLYLGSSWTPQRRGPRWRSGRRYKAARGRRRASSAAAARPTAARGSPAEGAHGAGGF